MRVFCVNARWEEEMYGARALRIGKLIFTVIAAAHWIACGWYFCGMTEGMELDGTVSAKGWVKETFESKEYVVSHFVF